MGFSKLGASKEDVTEIVLNVKGITRQKLYSDTPKTVRIEASGEGGDCRQHPAGCRARGLNPDWHITTGRWRKAGDGADV